MIGSAQLVADRDLAGDEVDQAAGNEERGDTARALVAQGVTRLDDAFDAADAGADQHAGGDLVLIGFRMPAGIGKRHVGGGHAVDDEGIDLALLLWLHPLIDIEGAVGAITDRNTTGDLGGKVVDLEFGDEAGAVLTGKQPGPRHLGSAS